MNNEQQSEQQKAIRRFFIALLCAAVVDLFLASMDHGSDDVVWVFFYTFFIVFIPISPPELTCFVSECEQS